ncbi:hypothetical protein MUK42_16665, partial [Musa troglodytarum]
GKKGNTGYPRLNRFQDRVFGSEARAVRSGSCLLIREHHRAHASPTPKSTAVSSSHKPSKLFQNHHLPHAVIVLYTFLPRPSTLCRVLLFLRKDIAAISEMLFVNRFRELVPILLQYVRSRQVEGRPVIWVAHNGRRFDVPFMIKEFQRCSVEIPPDWMFVDTLPLARQLVKADGSKLSSFSLKALREHYEIPLVGPAHRAMQDVMTLCYVLQRITFDLKLS